MKAFILAAGFGTRLKPWTLEHPKALVPVHGVPMLRRVIDKLRGYGFDSLTVNVHHFADQIVDYIEEEGLEDLVKVSDESEGILDTGGGLLNAAPQLFVSDSDPVLVHNVDILSDAPLREIMARHELSGADISLVTSLRESSRKLVFDHEGNLRGWHNLGTGEFRPEGFLLSACMHECAFSGIYVVSEKVVKALEAYAKEISAVKFPIMDFLLHNVALSSDSSCKLKINEIELPELNLIDIGKPETLCMAESRALLFE